MTWLPPDIEDRFPKSEQTLHHNDGLWNGIAPDQFLEQTWMKSGKGPGGVIGTTQSPQTVLTKSYSQNAVLTWVSYLHKLIEEDSGPKLKHKEESAGRIKSDEDDKEMLLDKLGEIAAQVQLFKKIDKTKLMNIQNFIRGFEK